MREFDLPDFVYNISRCEMYGHYPQLTYKDEKTGEVRSYWNEKTTAEFAQMFDRVRAHCEHMGLPVARQVADYQRRMKQDGYDPKLLSKDLSSLRQTIVNELRDYRYCEIPKDDVKLYERVEQFSPRVFKAFRKTEKDLAAASRCLALDQGTACVFHLMRAMEVTVQKFGGKVSKFAPKPISIDLYKDSWGEILNMLGPVIKQMPSGTPREKKRKEHFDDIYSSLDHVKRAWRNKTAHPRYLEYKPREARRIYGAVQGFLETLAGEI